MTVLGVKLAHEASMNPVMLVQSWSKLLETLEEYDLEDFLKDKISKSLQSSHGVCYEKF
jgi:hypothetical protein